MKVHETRLRVRFSECDLMGVVYHPAYLSYFEVGRTELIRELGLSYAEIERAGWRLFVIEAAVRYRAPARYDEAITVRTRLVELGAARLGFAYEVVRDANAVTLADGTTVLASVDHTGKPRRLPAPFRAACAPWLMEEG